MVLLVRMEAHQIPPSVQNALALLSSMVHCASLMSMSVLTMAEQAHAKMEATALMDLVILPVFVQTVSMGHYVKLTSTSVLFRIHVKTAELVQIPMAASIANVHLVTMAKHVLILTGVT